MSLDEKEIKEAIEFYRNWQPGGARSSDDIEKYENILVTLAEHYLSIAGKMPEEKTGKDENFSFLYQQHLPLAIEVYNQVRQECILAFTKEKQSIYLKGVEDGKEMVRKGLPTEIEFNEFVLRGNYSSEYKQVTIVIFRDFLKQNNLLKKES